MDEDSHACVYWPKTAERGLSLLEWSRMALVVCYFSAIACLLLWSWFFGWKACCPVLYFSLDVVGNMPWLRLLDGSDASRASLTEKYPNMCKFGSDRERLLAGMGAPLKLTDAIVQLLSTRSLDSVHTLPNW